MAADDRKERFAEEYLKDLDAKAAAIRCGLSPKGAATAGWRLLQDETVQELIRKGMIARSKRVQLEQDEVVKELKVIGFSDPIGIVDEKGQRRALHQIPEQTRRAIASVKYDEFGNLEKVQFWPKNNALELLARHLGMIEEEAKRKLAAMSDEEVLEQVREHLEREREAAH